jgi:hypothetical protein
MKPNVLHKQKFTNNTNKEMLTNTPGFWQSANPNINSNYTTISKSNLNSKSKSQIVMTNELHPNNYDLSITNIGESNNKITDMSLYTSGYMTGPGRGFGNLNVSNSLRYGDMGRDLEMNTEQTTSNRLYDNPLNTYNVVIPIQRGGESTRIKKSENVNDNDEDDSSRFIFKY